MYQMKFLSAQPLSLCGQLLCKVAHPRANPQNLRVPIFNLTPLLNAHPFTSDRLRIARRRRGRRGRGRRGQGPMRRSALGRCGGIPRLRGSAALALTSSGRGRRCGSRCGPGSGRRCERRGGRWSGRMGGHGLRFLCGRWCGFLCGRRCGLRGGGEFALGSSRHGSGRHRFWLRLGHPSPLALAASRRRCGGGRPEFGRRWLGSCYQSEGCNSFDRVCETGDESRLEPTRVEATLIERRAQLVHLELLHVSGRHEKNRGQVQSRCHTYNTNRLSSIKLLNLC